MSLHLVTGGAGFVGSVIAEVLQKSGQRVRIFDLNVPQAPLPGVEYVRGDVLNEKNLADAMKDVSFVHHAAALVPLHRAKKNFQRVNVEGSKNTFRAARDAGVQHFCQISSSAVYGTVNSSDCPLKSDFVPKPFEDYGKSKLEADQFIADSQSLSGAPTFSILRPRTVIGPGRLGVLQLLFEWIRLGCHVYLPGDGKNKFQLLDVRDLAQASVAASIARKQGTFLLVAEEFGTLFDDLSALCVHAKSGSKVRKVHPLGTLALDVCNRLGLSPLSKWHLQAAQHDLYFDLQKAKSEIGWQPQFSNQRMLAEAYDWYLANRKKIGTQSTNSIHQRPLKWGVLALTKLGGRWTQK